VDRDGFYRIGRQSRRSMTTNMPGMVTRSQSASASGRLSLLYRRVAPLSRAGDQAHEQS
jgi:hypothetical protein